MGTPVAPIANAVMGTRAARWALERTLGIHHRAAMPRWSGRTLRGWARRRRGPGGPRSVVYFHGCAANYYEPHVGRMAVEVLEHNGLHVVITKQGCCGLPLQSNGLFPAARRTVRALGRRLWPYARAGYDIVGTSTSCTLMLKREAREILGVEDRELRVVGAQTFDICEYLLAMHERGELRTDFRPVDLRVPYHAPCQQRGHGIGKPALDLFDLVPGLEVIELDRACCGVAGTYGLKREKYDIAMSVGAGLFDDIRASGADTAVCDSETCRWHIGAATGATMVHPVEVLHRAYGLSG
jgi:glycerol-3-phosphate dehydrogenase subunit C